MADAAPERPAEERRPLRPLGAPTDPLRPTGRVADEAVGGSQARLAAQAGRVLRVLLVVLGIAVLLAVVVSVALAFVPKPDL